MNRQYRVDGTHTTFNATETRILGMDSDSPVNARTAGQPIRTLGTSFTAGNTRKFRTWTRRAACGLDSVRRALGYRRLSASHRVPIGQGHLP